MMRRKNIKKKILFIMLILFPLVLTISSMNTVYAGPWITDSSTVTSSDDSETDYSIETPDVGFAGAWVIEIILGVIIFILQGISSILNVLTKGLIGGYLDEVILQGSGVKGYGSNTIAAFYCFQMLDGNIYAEAASVLYAILAMYSIMFIVVRFFMSMGNAGLTTSSQEGRMIIKESVTGSAFAIIAVILMPQYYNVCLVIVRKMVAAINGSAQSWNSMLSKICGFGGLGNMLDLSLSELFQYNTLDELFGCIIDLLIVAALMIGSVVLTGLIAYDYVMLAFSFALHFLAFPFRAIVSSVKIKASFMEWNQQFYELLLTPLIDIVIVRFVSLMFYFLSKMAILGMIPAMFITVIIFFAFFPARMALRMYIGVNATAADRLEKGIQANLFKAAIIGRKAKDSADKRREMKKTADAYDNMADQESQKAESEQRQNGQYEGGYGQAYGYENNDRSAAMPMDGDGAEPIITSPDEIISPDKASGRESENSEGAGRSTYAATPDKNGRAMNGSMPSMSADKNNKAVDDEGEKDFAQSEAAAKVSAKARRTGSMSGYRSDELNQNIQAAKAEDNGIGEDEDQENASTAAAADAMAFAERRKVDRDEELTRPITDRKENVDGLEHQESRPKDIHQIGGIGEDEDQENASTAATADAMAFAERRKVDRDEELTRPITDRKENVDSFEQQESRPKDIHRIGEEDQENASTAADAMTFAEKRKALVDRDKELTRQIADKKENIDSLEQQEAQLGYRNQDINNAKGMIRDNYQTRIDEQNEVAAAEDLAAAEAAGTEERNGHIQRSKEARLRAQQLRGEMNGELARQNTAQAEVNSQIAAIRAQKTDQRNTIAAAQSEQRQIQAELRNIDESARIAAGTRYTPGSREQQELHAIASKYATLGNFDSPEYKGAFSHAEMAAMYAERAKETRAAANKVFARSVVGGTVLGAAGTLLGGGIGLVGGAMAGIASGTGGAEQKLENTLAKRLTTYNAEQLQKKTPIHTETPTGTVTSSVVKNEKVMDGATSRPVRRTRIRSYVKGDDGNYHLKETSVVNSRMNQSYQQAADEGLLVHPNISRSRAEINAERQAMEEDQARATVIERAQMRARQIIGRRGQKFNADIMQAVTESAASVSASLRADQIHADASRLEHSYNIPQGHVSQEVSDLKSRTKGIINQAVEPTYGTFYKNGFNGQGAPITPPDNITETINESIEPEATPTSVRNTPLNMLSYHHDLSFPENLSRWADESYPDTSFSDIQTMSRSITEVQAEILDNKSGMIRDFKAIMGTKDKRMARGSDEEIAYSIASVQPMIFRSVAEASRQVDAPSQFIYKDAEELKQMRLVDADAAQSQIRMQEAYISELTNKTMEVISSWKTDGDISGKFAAANAIYDPIHAAVEKGARSKEYQRAAEFIQEHYIIEFANKAKVPPSVDSFEKP